MGEITAPYPTPGVVETAVPVEQPESGGEPAPTSTPEAEEPPAVSESPLPIESQPPEESQVPAPPEESQVPAPPEESQVPVPPEESQAPVPPSESAAPAPEETPLPEETAPSVETPLPTQPGQLPSELPGDVTIDVDVPVDIEEEIDLDRTVTLTLLPGEGEGAPITRNLAVVDGAIVVPYWQKGLFTPPAYDELFGGGFAAWSTESGETLLPGDLCACPEEMTEAEFTARWERTVREDLLEPIEVTGNPDGTALFSLPLPEMEEYELTLQWQYSEQYDYEDPDAAEWTDIPGAMTAEYLRTLALGDGERVFRVWATAYEREEETDVPPAPEAGAPIAPSPAPEPTEAPAEIPAQPAPADGVQPTAEPTETPTAQPTETPRSTEEPERVPAAEFASEPVRAQGTPLQDLAVTLLPGRGSGARVELADKLNLETRAYPLPEAPASFAAPEEDALLRHVFSGWSADGGKTVLKPGQTYTVPLDAGEVLLCAFWVSELKVELPTPRVERLGEETATFSITLPEVTGYTLTAQWQQGDGNTWADIPGAVGETYVRAIAAGDETLQFRCVARAAKLAGETVEVVNPFQENALSFSINLLTGEETGEESGAETPPAALLYSPGVGLPELRVSGWKGLGQEMLVNGSFEDGLTGWGYSSGWVNITGWPEVATNDTTPVKPTVGAYNGTLIKPAGAGDNLVALGSVSTSWGHFNGRAVYQYIPVLPGSLVEISFYGAAHADGRIAGGWTGISLITPFTKETDYASLRSESAVNSYVNDKSMKRYSGLYSVPSDVALIGVSITGQKWNDGNYGTCNETNYVDLVSAKTVAMPEIYVSSTGRTAAELATGLRDDPLNTLEEALLYTVNGGTIYVMDEFIQSKTLTVSSGKKVTITADPNPAAGVTPIIKRGSGDGALLSVTNGTVTLKNLTLDGQGGQVDKDGASLGGSIAASDALVLLDSGSTGALVLRSGAVLQNANSGAGAGAIRQYGGTVTIDGGTIQYCSATGEKDFSSASAVYLRGPNTAFYMKSGTISHNSGAAYAALTFYLNGSAYSGKHIISGGVIEDNATTRSDGTGGILADTDGHLAITGGTIRNNTGSKAGGLCFWKTSSRLYLGGDAATAMTPIVITGNRQSASAAAENNLYLNVSGALIQMRTPLYEGSDIGVSSGAPTATADVKLVTGAGAADAQYFHLDDPSPTVGLVYCAGTTDVPATGAHTHESKTIWLTNAKPVDVGRTEAGAWGADGTFVSDPAYTVSMSGTAGWYYALLDKDGSVVPVTAAGAAAANNGWYRADGAGTVTLTLPGAPSSGQPYRVVSAYADSAAPTADGLRSSMSRFYYVAGAAGSDGHGSWAAGSDTTGDGSHAKPYATLKKACDQISASSAGAVLVLNDVTVSSSQNFDAEKTIVVAGEGAVTDGAVKRAPRVLRDTSLKSDFVFKLSSGTVNFANLTMDGNAGWDNVDDLKGRKAANSSVAQFMSVSGTAQMTLDNGAVLQNHARVPNSASGSDYGGGVYLTGAGAALIMKDGAKILNCHAGQTNGDGGAVSVWTGATFTMTGGELRGNTATRFGGALRSATSGIVELRGGSITGNAVLSADSFGGGVAVTQGEVKASGGTTVTGNKNLSGAYAADDNVGVMANRTLTLAGPLTGEIGICTALGDSPAGRVIAVAAEGHTITESDRARVTSDAGYRVVLSDNQLKFGLMDDVYVSSTGKSAASGGVGSRANPLSNLTDAYKVVADGGTIHVMDNMTLPTTGGATFAQTKAFTIQSDSNGDLTDGECFAITLPDAATNALFVVSGGHLTIKNLTMQGSGKEKTVRDNYFISVENGAVVTLGSGATVQNVGMPYTSSGAWGILVVWSSGTLVMEEGSTLKDCTASSGPIRLAGDSTSKFIMNGGEIRGCDSRMKEGSAIYVALGATAEINGGLITNCGMTYMAKGTIYLHQGGNNKLAMTGGAIVGNSATLGGGVYCSNSNGNSITLSGNPVISNNIGTALGGGISNIYLSQGQKLALGAAGLAPRDGVEPSIGVYAETIPNASTDVKIAVGASAADTGYFHSDNAGEAGVLYCTGDGGDAPVEGHHAAHEENTLWLTTGTTAPLNSWVTESMGYTVTLDAPLVGWYYALVDKNGQAVPGVTAEGGSAAANGWQAADGTAIVFTLPGSPTAAPYRAVCAYADSAAPKGDNLSMGKSQFIYLAGTAESDGHGSWAAGSDTAGDGSRAKPYASVSAAYAQISAEQPGVILPLNDIYDKGTTTLGGGKTVCLGPEADSEMSPRGLLPSDSSPMTGVYITVEDGAHVELFNVSIDGRAGSYRDTLLAVSGSGTEVIMRGVSRVCAMGSDSRGSLRVSGGAGVTMTDKAGVWTSTGAYPGVYLEGTGNTFRMEENAVITGNTVTDAKNGGVLCVPAGNTVELCGNVRMENNKSGDGQEAGAFLGTGATLTVTGALGDSARIPVRSATPVTALTPIAYSGSDEVKIQDFLTRFVSLNPLPILFMEKGAPASIAQDGLYLGGDLLKVQVPSELLFAALPNFSSTVVSPTYSISNLSKYFGLKVEAVSLTPGAEGSGFTVGDRPSDVNLALRTIGGWEAGSSGEGLADGKPLTPSEVYDSFVLGELEKAANDNTPAVGTFAFTGSVGKAHQSVDFADTLRAAFHLRLKFTSIGQ